MEKARTPDPATYSLDVDFQVAWIRQAAAEVDVDMLSVGTARVKCPA
jgi:hypothetical protein